MNAMNSKLALGLLVVTLPGWAQQAPAPEPAASKAVLASEQPERSTARGGEPNVKHTVIEDNGSRIDELRVRGQTQRITVTPKIGPTKSYEIITGDAAHELPEGTGGARNATGKRVWNVLDF